MSFQLRRMALASVWISFAFIMTMPCLAAPDEKPPDKREYEFVQDTDRLVSVVRGKTEIVGTLDSAGIFTPHKDWPNLTRGQRRSGPIRFTLINGTACKGCYEYRSGRLILGDIDDEGNFIPTAGEKVIDFKDYQYIPFGPKIYNLPGKFVRKGEKEEKK